MRKVYIGAGILIVAFLLIAFFQPRENTILGSLFLNTVTNSSSTVGDSVAVRIFDSNSATHMRTISYLNGTGTAYLWFISTSTGVAKGSGYALFASTSVKMCQNGCDLPLWMGQVWSITGGGTSTLSTVDG